MWIFRNRELARQMQASALVLLFGTVAALWFKPEAAGAVFLYGLLWWGLHILWERRRYREMRSLSDQIDEILHGAERLELSHFREGDLEILRDEIQKMTVRLQEQAQQLEREKTSLADALTDISHQIRTPLTTLYLLLERLKSNQEDSSQKRVRIREAEQMLDKIGWLVTALLKMSKLDAGAVTLKPQTISLEPFLREAIRPFEVSMEVHGKTYEIRGAGEASFTGDYEWTLEAVQNVLKNGMEYTPDGGRLAIACQENPLFTEITVTDSGRGIDEEDLPHLFERFYRGKNAGDHSFGVGLALSRMILSRENAVIRAQNAKGGGGQFQIRFYKTAV